MNDFKDTPGVLMWLLGNENNYGLPGSEGAGVAEVLFGDHDFPRRLPLSWPMEMPGENGAGADGSGDGRGPVLFPRGYGLRMG